MSSPSDPPAGVAPTGAARGNLIAGAIGSVLEWYDFAIYGYLAPVIGTLFFPAGDPVASLLAAFGVFAIGFAARPVGGAILGYIGDRVGRKPALMISMVTMGAATFAIGVLPTHAHIGGAAALALVVLRIAAGLSVGGEYTGAIILLGEHAPPERRALYAASAAAMASSPLRIALCASSVPCTGHVTGSSIGPVRILAPPQPMESV
jgi:MFS transporter, MHS family, proline/betaine transporter